VLILVGTASLDCALARRPDDQAFLQFGEFAAINQGGKEEETRATKRVRAPVKGMKAKARAIGHGRIAQSNVSVGTRTVPS